MHIPLAGTFAILSGAIKLWPKATQTACLPCKNFSSWLDSPVSKFSNFNQSGSTIRVDVNESWLTWRNLLASLALVASLAFLFLPRK